MHVVLLKGKPIPEGLKMYVLSESETGYILNAFLQHKKLKTEKEEHGTNFGIVMELLEGNNIDKSKEWSLLDQGFTVSNGRFSIFQGLKDSINPIFRF